jgi:tripartite-type tricarboxylate transporter receptor subunit TctC
LQTPDFIEALAKNGLQPLHQSPEEFAALLKRDTAHWAMAAKTTGFTAED